jgi:flagellar L-ring protein precursor FlgH
MKKAFSSVCDMKFNEPNLAVLVAIATLAAVPLPATSQSLWQDSTSKAMFADKRASRVGDLITIVVQENTTANKNNETTTKKTASMDAAITAFLYSPAASGLLTKGGTLPALKYSSANTFDGGGTIANSEQIVSQVTVRVIDVLPNRNMVIEGTRETAFGGEKQNVVLRGIVRPEDVAFNNTVFSYNVADAKIQIITKGAITDSQRKGWFTKIWDKLSPF